MTEFLKHFVHDEEGASLVEYSVLIGLVTIATIALVLSVGQRVTGAWTRLDAAMAAGGMTPVGPAAQPAAP